jgi:nicotinate-nucleotide adenylyltransferase
MQHSVILRESVRILRAPCAIVMPAAKNPLKRDAPPATPDARLALCRANFGNAARDTGAEVRLSTLELNRAGASYTVDTVIDLIRAHPHLRGAIRVLIGSDAVRDIERWRRWEELLTLATPAIVVRPPDTLAATRAFLAEFAQRSGFLDAPNWVLPIDSIACASTTARSDLAQGARPDGLADAVFDEITARRLYGFGDQR